MVAMQHEPAIYYAGGRYPSSNSFSVLDTVERIVFEDGPESGISELTAQPLSRARAMIGCSVMGALQRKAMFAGGWYYESETLLPTDEVDILDTDTQEWTLSRLSHKSVAVTIASIKSLVLVTGGTTTQSEPPTSGTVIQGSFDYASYSQLGIDRYNEETGEWTFVPNVLTQLLHDTFTPPRIAVSFAGT